MKSPALALLLAASLATPALADDLSFRDLGPWTQSGAVSAARVAHLSQFGGMTSVPKTGTASYSGIPIGKADLTPSTTNVTAHDGLTGTMSLDVNFGTFATTGTLGNFTVSDPKAHTQTALPLSLSIENVTNTPFSGNRYTATVSTFSNFEPVDGQLSGRFIGPDAVLTAGHWQAAGRIPQFPTLTSSTSASLHAGFVAVQVH